MYESGLTSMITQSNGALERRIAFVNQNFKYICRQHLYTDMFSASFFFLSDTSDKDGSVKTTQFMSNSIGMHFGEKKTYFGVYDDQIQNPLIYLLF